MSITTSLFFNKAALDPYCHVDPRCFLGAWCWLVGFAKTDEVVIASGQLEPIGSVQDIQMPAGGVADQILVTEGEQVKAGQVLMKLDTEASEEQRISLETAIGLKQEQLLLKGDEKQNYLQINQEEIAVLQNNLVLQTEILERYRQLEEAGAFSKCST